RPRQRGAVPTGHPHPRPPTPPRRGTAHHAPTGKPARRPRPSRTQRSHPPHRRTPTQPHPHHPDTEMTAAIQVSHHPAPATTPPAPTSGSRGSVAQLRRFQWAVRATLAIGVAASVCANVLNARNNPISQAIAAWPPLALLLTVELVSRVPVHRRLLAIARIGGTAVIAGIAAYVSYFHMAAVVSRYGEHPPNPYLLPLSVDGLIVVASVSLVELSGRVRAALDQQTRYGVQPAPDEQATVPVDVVPIRGTAPSGSGPEAVAEDN